jgi:hypothetical protein
MVDKIQSLSNEGLKRFHDLLIVQIMKFAKTPIRASIQRVQSDSEKSQEMSQILESVEKEMGKRGMI